MTMHDVGVRPAGEGATAGRAVTDTGHRPGAVGHEARPAVDEVARRAPWHRAYRRVVLAVDAAVLTAAVALAAVVRFGIEDGIASTSTLTYAGLGVVIAAMWWTTLQCYGAADERVLGDGPSEYRRVVHASVMAFGVVAIVTLLVRQDLSRGYLAIAFPVGLVGLLAGRRVLRGWLGQQRWHGAMTTNVLVVGGPRSAQSIAHHFATRPRSGYTVTGVWVPDDVTVGHRWLPVANRVVPLLSGTRSLADALAAADAGAVVVTDTEHLGHHGLKELTWQLRGYGVDLMVSPNVMDVATPRVHVRPVSGMPFLHLREPNVEGATRWGKQTFDRVLAGAAVVGLAPVLIGAALAVRLTSPGPVLYRSERIGVGGQPFQMLKFRSMVVDADQVKDALTADQDGVLFKMRDDPRVINKDIDRDKILIADEALEYGLIDQVLTSRKTLPAAIAS